jgi:fluoroacetyl-CoA thioesterase
MSTLLQPGLTYSHTFVVSESKLVPALYPEAPELQIMPNVFATGFLVGLLEWTCIKAINPHIDWPSQQSVGTSIDIKHLAATAASSCAKWTAGGLSSRWKRTTGST